MSATNTTTNYSLPIFVGSDKPAWLVDFNGAMNAIDAQMKVNADAIATKSPILTFSDTTDIDFTVTGSTVEASLDAGVAGTISRAFTKPVSAPAAAQIPAVDTSNNQQLLNLGTGLQIDNGTLNAIDLNLTRTGTSSTFTVISGGPLTTTGSMHYAFNNDYTVGKIYGWIELSGSGSGWFSIDTGITIPSIAEQFSIDIVGSVNQVNYLPGTPAYTFKTNGHILVGGARSSSGSATRLILYPCLYFLQDFGDTPTP